MTFDSSERTQDALCQLRGGGRTMDSWCEELLLALLQQLSVRERAVLARVCRKFCRLFSDVTLWRDVAVTFTQGQVLLRAGRSDFAPVADIVQYAERYGSMAESLQLKICSSLDASDFQLQQFLVKMECAKLECLSLSLKEVSPHLIGFLKSQTALQRARVTSVFPLPCLQCLTEICQSSASELRELCWHYQPLRLSPSTRSGQPRSLQQLGRFSADGTSLQRALQVFCQAAGRCCKLRLFRTNVYCSAIWRQLVNSTYKSSAPLLTVALTVDESSTLSEPATAALTAEECHKFRVVVYVRSLFLIDINSLINLPGQLPICEMHVTLNTVGEEPIATAIVRRMTAKFQQSLTTMKLLNVDCSRGETCADSLRNRVQNWSVFLACLSLGAHACPGPEPPLRHPGSSLPTPGQDSDARILIRPAPV